MDKKPRVGSMSDADRSYIGRRQTPRAGTAVPVAVDEEATPPPMPPPPAPSFEMLSIEEKVAQLRSVAGEHAEGIERVWHLRNTHEQVITIGKDVAELAGLMREFMMPAVKTLLGRVDAIERTSDSRRGKEDRFWEHEWPAAMKTLDALASHTGRIEKDVDRVERNLDVFIKRSEEQHSNTRVEIAGLKAMDDKQEGRLRQLEDFVLTLKVKIAMVSAGFGLLGGVLVWAVEKYA